MPEMWSEATVARTHSNEFIAFLWRSLSFQETPETFGNYIFVGFCVCVCVSVSISIAFNFIGKISSDVCGLLSYPIK